MEFRVLGPLEVDCDGGVLDVRGSKRRAVLALLVLHANEVVRADRLIEEIWGEHRPTNASAALQNQISRLRKDLGNDVFVTKPWGYVLRIDPEMIDLRRFERLVAEARPLAARERADTLGKALALWRGPALADLADEPAFSVEIQRLEDLHLAALEQRIDADLELARHEGVIHELEALVAEHPLRERFRGQLILALYRSGRQAEALETYRETRRVLVEELGIEPSAELRELERAILRQDPVLAPVPVALEPEPVDTKRRWRWPRSPLLIASGALLVAGVGAAAALLAQKGDGQSGLPDATPPAAAAANSTPELTHVTPQVATHASRQTRTRPQRTRRHRVRTPASPRPQPNATHSTIPKRRTKAAPSHTPAAAKSNTKLVYWLVDNFDDPAVDHAMWHIASHGKGVEVGERNGRLELSISPDAIREHVYGADQHYGTNCLVNGDFDASVEYELLTWPALNGVRVTFGMYFPPPHENFLAVERSGGLPSGGSEGYDMSPASGAWVQTEDRSGALRLARKNGIVSSYYRYGNQWVKLGSKFAPTSANLILSFNAGEDPTFGHNAAAAAFDNFRAQADDVNCPGVPLPPRRRKA